MKIEIINKNGVVTKDNPDMIEISGNIIYCYFTNDLSVSSLYSFPINKVTRIIIRDSNQGQSESTGEVRIPPKTPS